MPYRGLCACHEVCPVRDCSAPVVPRQEEFSGAATGSLCAGDLDKCTVCLIFFGSVFTRDDGTPELCSRVDTKQLYLDSVTFTPETVCSTLKKLKPTTSLGPDNIPNIFLKKCANALCVPLAHIFDTSFKDNTLPYCWKTANIQPVFKKGHTNDPSNYRPISLTSTCCRTMERIVNNHILNYLLENQLITRHQHGFMRKKSTCTNLLECLHDWSVNIHSRNCTNVVYFDFKKAFDSVSHPKLLIKLKAYGLTVNSACMDD